MFWVYVLLRKVWLLSELFSQGLRVDKELCHTWARHQTKKKVGERGEKKESVPTEVWMSQLTGTPGLDIDHWDIQGALRYSRDKKNQTGWGLFFSDLGFFFFKKIFYMCPFLSSACGGTLSLKDRVVPSTSKGEDLNSEMSLK